MPLYEYYCRECDGAFELLRPVREAAKAQPCPVCDEDADRIVSKEWSAFIFRDGYSRRLPDDGGYWHLGKKVSRPISGPSDGYSHPDLVKRTPTPEPTVEDVERYEVLRDVRRERDLSVGSIVEDEMMEQREGAMRKQLARQAAAKVEREKQRAARRLAAEERKAQQEIRQEQVARTQESVKRRTRDTPPRNKT